ncbi:MAG: MerR family transcriptional regulator [Propionibacterium sp.]|nr:MerR family transcriptional regulator [Propionibacterium sp.]
MNDGWLRIGEVARRTGLTVRALHHYDRLGLLVPSERSWGDHRLYTPSDLRRLLDIQHLRSLGLSLAEVQAALDDPGFDPNLVLDQHIDRLTEQIALQQRLLDRLRLLRAGNETAWPDLLDTIALIARLRHPEATVRVRAALDAEPIPLPVLIERIATETDPDVLGVLVWAVVRHGRPAVGPLIDLLDTSGPGVRLHLVHALDKLGERDAVPALRTLLDDPEQPIRAAAATALGRLGDERALPDLIGLLGTTEEPLGAAVTDALIHFGDAAATALALAPPADPAARTQAVEVLEQLDGPRARSALIARADDHDPQVRLAAVFALAGVPGEAADAAIARAAGSGDPHLVALARRISADRRRSAGGSR